ncbi:MAG: HEAT repeat domain-containing protein [Planctomycetes bacterium]|nr:HEAT repeat domain-containing protein [Planctomycetota bacterium]
MFVNTALRGISASRVLSLLAAGALFVLGGCAAPSAESRQMQPLDPQTVSVWKKEFADFAAALLSVGSRNPQDQRRGLEQAAAMAPYQYFEDDQALIRAARAGDEPARKELARRGEVLDAVQTYMRPFDRTRWEGARRRILAQGQDMGAYLSMILVGSLLMGQNRSIYREIRYELAEIGEEALMTVAGVLAEKIDRASDTPIGHWEDITQLAAALVAFGDRGLADLNRVMSSPKRYVRICGARAVAEARAIERADLVAKLLREDPEWEVRAVAAEVLGDLRGGGRSWMPLLEALDRERDSMVLQKIILALGRAGCKEAVPRLVAALDVPRMEIVERAAEALADITGQHFTTREAWHRWYRERYPAWKAGR